MKSETRVAYAEIEEILRYMPKIYIDKIPMKLKEFFHQEKDEKHNFKYDNSKKLANQNINKKTRTVLAILKLNYWCISEEEKSIWKHKFIKNEEDYQKNLSEKYNPDNIFKISTNKTSEEDDIKENVSLVEYKEQSYFIKLINKIIDLFKKT